MCATSFCTRGALDAWSRGRSTAALYGLRTLTRTRALLSWLALGAGVATALIYLNSAAYSAWISGGPPNDYPEAWAHRSLVHVCYAAAAVLGALAAFRSIRRFPRLGALTVCFGIAALLLLAVGDVREFFAVDACLDRGGSWAYEEFRCTT